VNIGAEYPDLSTLAVVIAHSQIVILEADQEPLWQHRPLPAGFDDVDAAVLAWIAAEGRRVGRAMARL
jgi:hypothetical protein